MIKMFALLFMLWIFSVQGFAAENGSAVAKNRLTEQQGIQQTHQRCFGAKGVVRKIDRNNGVVTIFYDAVPALLWPPMTMPFAVRDVALFERFKVGERVEFEFVLEAHTGLIVTVK